MACWVGCFFFGFVVAFRSISARGLEVFERYSNRWIFWAGCTGGDDEKMFAICIIESHTGLTCFLFGVTIIGKQGEPFKQCSVCDCGGLFF